MKQLIFGASMCLLVACSGPATPDPSIPVTPPQTLDPLGLGEPLLPDDTIAAIFERYGVEGSLVIYNEQAQHYTIYNEDRAKEPRCPASTFKVMNSLVALETNTIGVNDTIKWDGEQRMYDKWNMDQTMRTAIRYSCVWYYQEVARRVGAEQMQHILDTVGYGNADISDGIDVFWLEGSLKISPMEQVDFLQRLIHDELPLKKETMATVREIMMLDSTDEYILRAKTGWALRTETDEQHGWWVGYVQRDGNNYIFAINIDMSTDEQAQYRQRIVLDVFQKKGLLPEEVVWR